MLILSTISFIYNTNILKLKIIRDMKGKKLKIKWWNYFNPYLIQKVADDK